MEVFELRGFLKERGIKGHSTLKKAELEAKMQKLQKQEKAEKYEQNLRDTAICGACLLQQRVQRKIDGETFTQRLLNSVVRTLVF